MMVVRAFHVFVAIFAALSMASGQVLSECETPQLSDCTRDVCYFPAHCQKDPIPLTEFLGSQAVINKRDVDCSKPITCDRCIPSTCYFDPVCNKEPITNGPEFGTLGKRCLGNMGTLG